MTTAPPVAGSKRNQPPSASGLDGQAVDNSPGGRYARNAVAVDIALYRRGFAERGVKLCPIDFVGVGLTCERNHDAEGSK
jgi:hypothetical protein